MQDEQTFSQLFFEYKGFIDKAVIRMLKEENPNANAEDIEDAQAEAYMDLRDCYGRYGRVKHNRFQYVLAKAMLHTIKDRKRINQAKKRQAVLIPLNRRHNKIPGKNELEEMIEQEERAFCLKSLGRERLELLEEYLVQGRIAEQIAKGYSVTVRTVFRRVAEAVEAFKSVYARNEEE